MPVFTARIHLAGTEKYPTYNITIPKEVILEFGLKKGDFVSIEIVDVLDLVPRPNPKPTPPQPKKRPGRVPKA